MRNKRLKTLMLTAVIIAALVLAAAGCIRAPIEQGPVTNPNQTTQPAVTDPTSDATTEPAETTESEDPAESGETTAPTETEKEPKPSRPAETTITIELEGMQEDIKAMLYMSDLGYSMYYDFERYQVIQTSGRLDGSVNVDEYLPASPAEELPDVYMQVGHYEDLSPEEALTKIEGLLRNQFNDVVAGETIKVGVDELEGHVLRASNGSKWDSEIARATIISDEADGSYFFISGYFLEAAEGYGSRYTQMMDSFRVD
jgi:hypothetical protein